MLFPRLPGLAAVLALAAATVATGVGCGGTHDDRPAKWSFISPTIIEPACATVNCHSAITHQGGEDDDRSEAGEPRGKHRGIMPQGDSGSTLIAEIHSVPPTSAPVEIPRAAPSSTRSFPPG